MGVYLVRIENGMLEIPTLKQQIQEEKLNNKDIPVFYGINRETLSFPIMITKLYDYENDNVFSYEERVNILRWLCKGEYKEFISGDNDFIRYYVLFEEVTRYDNYRNQGYITLNCRLNAPYGFSPISVEEYDLSDNENTTIIELENNSNIIDNYYPEIEFTVLEGTSASFKNLSDMGNTFTINNLQPNETIYINMETGRIKSSLDNVYHLGDCNKQWLSLVYGINRIEVTGKIDFEIRTQFPMLL
jgi:hypothetical protein